MSAFKKNTLAVMTVLVMGLLVHDPHQAHRPPDLRTTSIVAAAVVSIA